MWSQLIDWNAMKEKLEILIKPLHSNFVCPDYAHEGDAGMDLYSTEAFTLNPGEHKKVNCGFSIAIPEGFLGAVAPRSGLAHQYGVTVLNSWGVIDSTYRGDIGVILMNLGQEPVTFPVKSRIAQLIIIPCQKVELIPTEEDLNTSERGINGFGSTGLKMRRKYE